MNECLGDFIESVFQTLNIGRVWFGFGNDEFRRAPVIQIMWIPIANHQINLDVDMSSLYTGCAKDLGRTLASNMLKRFEIDNYKMVSKKRPT